MKKISRRQFILVTGTSAMAMALNACGKETSSAVSGSDAENNAATTEKANAFGWVVPEKTLKIKLSNLSGDYAPSEDQKIGFDNMHQYLLDEFNVDLEVTLETGDGVESQNLALASGNYGDVVTNVTYATAQKFRDQGRAVEISSMMDTIGSNIKKACADIYPLIFDAEGKLFFLPRVTGAVEELPDYCAALRYDEYVAIGSPEIETPEDFYDAIQEIQEMTPNNPNGEFRYALSLFDWVTPALVGGYWGLKGEWEVSADNTMNFWAFTDAGYEMTAWFNKVYRDGNMDPDAFVNKRDDFGAKFSNERIVGNVGHWFIPYKFGHEVWQKTDPNTPEDKRYFHLGFKSSNAKKAYVTGKNKIGSNYTIITDKAKDPEAILKFIDFMATDKGMALFNWGIPNGVANANDPDEIIKSWDLAEDGTWSFDETAKAQFIDGTWDYAKERQLGATGGEYFMYRTNSRWDDGIFCVWPNQCWYEEDPWKVMMIENLDGTIYDSTAMQLSERSDEIILIQSAIADVSAQHWAICMQSKNDNELAKNWKTMQDAFTSAGIADLRKVMEENYKANMAKY